MSSKPLFDYPLFSIGFRVFFALAGLSALALIALWNIMMHNAWHLNNYYPLSIWHGHEMLLAYTSAVIAGFLLTAVKNWTGIRPVNNEQLALLSFIWLYGRVLPFYSGLLADEFIAFVDLAFLPVLAYFVSKPLLTTGDLKNLLFVVILLLMAVANVLIHGEILGILVGTASISLQFLVMAIVVMIVVIAGRLFPFFTERGLSGVICIRNPVLDLAAILSTIACFVLVLMSVSGIVLALIAVVAIAINLYRLASWYDPRVCYVPLLWVLYLGYVWIIIGFAGLALSAYGLISPLLAIHAFTVGGIGVLTLGMMARVALGHTGRALRASNVMAIAFFVINLAAFMRVIFPVLLPGWTDLFLVLANYLWLAAFSLFVFYYLPILTAPRADGQAD